MILDVGCGLIGKGDVNCDLHIIDDENDRNQKSSGIKLHSKMIPNFVLADANFLPFKDNYVGVPVLSLEKICKITSEKSAPNNQIFRLHL